MQHTLTTTKLIALTGYILVLMGTSDYIILTSGIQYALDFILIFTGIGLILTVVIIIMSEE